MREALERFFYRYGWDTRCRNLCSARMLRGKLERRAGHASWTLLDVGCGQRGLSAFLRGPSIIGSDLQPLAERGAHFHFVQSTATALPFRDRAFPAVSCIDVLEHLSPAQRVETIAECLRVASHLVLFAFPEGSRARECDLRFQEGCRARSRQIPPWVEEHLRYDYPIAEGVAAQVRQAAERSGRTARLTESACEPLSICRLVRDTASRSTLLYALCNLWFGFLAPLLRASTRQAGYRAVLLAELSSS